MLVGEKMSKPVITLSKEMSIHDALALFKRERIRRAPVVESGKLIGIVSDKDLLNATPSQVTSLSVWEINYALSKVTVQEVMTRKVLTVQVDTPIEQAAQLMADNKIGGLPVMRGENLVGIITETDLFKAFLELLGGRSKGVRVTVVMDDHPGQLAQLTKAIADINGSFVSFGQFAGTSSQTVNITFKVAGVTIDQIKDALVQVVKEIVDIRECDPL